MSKPLNSAQGLLLHTADLVGGDRAKSHGDKVDNHLKIANFWSMYLHNMGPRAKHGFTAQDVANMMELLKVARRQSGEHNPDDYADGAGYAAIAFECAEAEKPAATESPLQKLADAAKKAG